MNYFTEEGLKKFRETERGEWEYFAFLAGREWYQREDISRVIKQKGLTEFYDFGRKCGALFEMQELEHHYDNATVESLRLSCRLIREKLDLEMEKNTRLVICYRNGQTHELPDGQEFVLRNLAFMHSGMDFKEKYVVYNENISKKNFIDFLYEALCFASKITAKANKDKELNLLIFVAGLWNLGYVLSVPEELGFYIGNKNKVAIHEVGLKCNQLVKLYRTKERFNDSINGILNTAYQEMDLFIRNECKKLNIEYLYDNMKGQFVHFETYFPYGEYEVGDDFCIEQVAYNLLCGYDLADKYDDHSARYKNTRPSEAFKKFFDYVSELRAVEYRFQRFSERLLETMKEIER